MTDAQLRSIARVAALIDVALTGTKRVKETP